VELEVEIDKDNFMRLRHAQYHMREIYLSIKRARRRLLCNLGHDGQSEMIGIQSGNAGIAMQVLMNVVALS
jgi:hypothetical protein